MKDLGVIHTEILRSLHFRQLADQNDNTMKIHSIHAIQILDSRGNPTVEAYVELQNGMVGKASVPSGASTGAHEKVELRDGNKDEFEGKGVRKADKNINTEINTLLKGHDISKLRELDEKMIVLDGTDNKSRLGANAILAVSLASARALAHYKQEPLWKTLNSYYFPKTKPQFLKLMVNIVNGGAHANWNFDIQEFMIIPQNDSPSKAVEIAQEVFQTLGELLKKENLSLLKGDEGGYSPDLGSNEAVFEIIQRAVKLSNHEQDIKYGVDIAASELYKDEEYFFKKQNKHLSAQELSAYYYTLQTTYGVYSFEDPFAEDDWSNFSTFTKNFGNTGLIVGDDLYTTDPQRIQKGIAQKATNAVLIKPNQIGTLLETVEAIKLAKGADMKVVISHRSGETEDSFIADLSYACDADYLKAGSMSRSERLAKYNRLIEIEQVEILRMRSG